MFWERNSHHFVASLWNPVCILHYPHIWTQDSRDGSELSRRTDWVWREQQCFSRAVPSVYSLGVQRHCSERKGSSHTDELRRLYVGVLYHGKGLSLLGNTCNGLFEKFMGLYVMKNYCWNPVFCTKIDLFWTYYFRKYSQEILTATFFYWTLIMWHSWNEFNFYVTLKTILWSKDSFFLSPYYTKCLVDLVEELYQYLCHLLSQQNINVLMKFANC